MNGKSLKKILRVASEPFLHLFYPLLCLHCQEELAAAGPLFCPGCLEHLSLIETKGRCRTCFAELSKGRCDRCIRRKVVIHRQLAACEAMGPVHALIREIYQGRRDCIAAAASLMAYQWLEQKMLLPEYLIPLPSSFWQKQKIGLDISLCLAQEIGKIFSIPTLSILRRKFDRSHFLTTGEFCHLFKAKKAGVLCDRRVLLISVEQSDSSFRLAGQELKAFFPAQIDALSFAAKME